MNVVEERIYCVYKHTSPSAKSYIGQTKNYKYRCYQHQVTYKCPAFRNAINKYGWDNFTHEILEENLTLDDANLWEKCHIFINNSFGNGGYNLTSGGENFIMSEETKQKMRDNGIDKHGKNNPFYGKVHTEETCRKISENHAYFSGENHPMWGKTHSNETRQRMRDNAKRGENHHGFGKSRSDEVKLKISKGNTGKKWDECTKIIRGKSMETKYIIIFPDKHEEFISGLLKFCETYNLHSGNMSQIATGKRKSHAGFKCRYATEQEIIDNSQKD